jgi:hypothetical protein
MELKTLHINIRNDDGDDERMPDWDILTRILPNVRRKFKLCLITNNRFETEGEGEEIQGLARVIHGHPMISEFCSPVGFTFANLGSLCSALATLPSLESVVFGLREPEAEDQLVLLTPSL